MLTCFMTTTAFICLQNPNVQTVLPEALPVPLVADSVYRLPDLRTQAEGFAETPLTFRLTKRLAIREVQSGPYACVQWNKNVSLRSCSAFGLVFTNHF